MPNPYVDNERAAAFLEYYASDRMVKRSVDRLYTSGMQQRRLSRLRATLEAYPPQPRTLRTRAEIDAYLQQRVDGELLRRRQRVAELERVLYPERAPESQPVLTPEELDIHLQKVYAGPLRRRKMREAEIERVFGKSRDPNSLALVVPPRSPQRRDSKSEEGEEKSAAKTLEDYMQELKEREAGWRPPSLAPEHADAFLVHDYDLLHAASGGKKVTQWRPMTNRRGHKMSEQERQQWLSKLSAPVRVNPPVISEPRDKNAPPPFRVTD